MKGIIFNLLEGITTSQCGEDVWDDVLDRAAVEGAYTAIGSYPDGEFMVLLGAVPMAELDTSERLRWFGRGAMPTLHRRYPVFFADHTSTLPFLLTLNDVIHAEVRKLYPGATVPVFDFADDPADPDVLLLGYRSPRQLCMLAEGFVLGAAEFFGEDVQLSQDVCMLRGDDHCQLRCHFPAARPRG